jgi:predicted transposase YdaD
MFAAASATLRLDPARTKMISGFIDTYLKLNAQEEEIFKTEIAKFEPVQQEVVMEIVTSWMEEGIRRGRQQGRQEGRQEGRQQGRQEGRQQGELAVIMRLLNRRIGTVEPELQQRIRQLRLNQLEDLTEVLLDFSSAEDLIAWLNKQQG